MADAESRVPVGGARQRTILALLLLSPDRVVSVDTMVDVVWNGRPPATARTQIAICIAALRKTFRSQGAGEEIIATAHPGYQLNTTGHDIDAVDFGRLVQEAELAAGEGRTAEAAHAYAQALGLWRGPALTGVSGRLIEDEAGRLEELRLNVFDDSTLVQLELGRHQELVPELTAVVREHPLRERTRHHLMLAQYRSGRRAEALETFRDARRHFIDELGLEPGPDLQELHDAVLADDPALAVVAAEPAEPAPQRAPAVEEVVIIPSELPPDVPGFAGREDELAALDSLMDGTGEENVTPVGLITGVAGVGKTGLAMRWAHRVAERFPDGRLFADLRAYDEDHEATSSTEVLGRLLRSLGVPSQQVPAALEERVSLYRSVLASRSVLIVLDNVRTLAQIRPLLPGSGKCCVLVTSREQLEGLVTSPQRARVHLGALSEPEALRLLGHVVGTAKIDAVPGDSVRLAELCDRLPLALRIAAARLASKPHWTVRHLVARLSDERRRLDELSQGESQVRAGFALSYRYLPLDAARLYRRIGLLDAPDFTAWVGGALLDIDDLEAERLIEHLVDAQFLEVIGTDATGQLRYRFQNLLRLYARERAQEEEAEADRLAACERVFRTCLTLAEEAHRREYGGDFSIVHGRAPRRPTDPGLREALLAQPLEWYEAERLPLVAAVGQAARMGLAELAWDLTLSMTVLFETRNYIDDWRACAEQALEAARACGDVLGRAAMAHSLGAADLRLRKLDDAEKHLGTALELYGTVGQELGRALVLKSLAVIDRIRGDVGAAMRRLEEALPVFRAHGDLSSEAYAFSGMAQLELERDRPDTALELGLEAVRVSESIGEGGERNLAQSAYRVACAHLALERWEPAEETFLRVVMIVKEKSDMVGLAYALLGLGQTRFGAGSLQLAEITLLDALDIAQRVDSPLVEGMIGLALAETARRGGRTAEARDCLTAAEALFSQVGAPRWQERAQQLLDELGRTDS
ncbi:BTAD domain-containing putative transcriptional regulator [Streptomyces sp. NPDC057682]|uniref:AfsR/SARP family transcriptional regulator n=1 Tax=unclassified Streptomyces TaxID=2593676 RepID=UPI0036524D1F